MKSIAIVVVVTTNYDRDNNGVGSDNGDNDDGDDNDGDGNDNDEDGNDSDNRKYQMWDMCVFKLKIKFKKSFFLIFKIIVKNILKINSTPFLSNTFYFKNYI